MSSEALSAGRRADREGEPLSSARSSTSRRWEAAATTGVEGANGRSSRPRSVASPRTTLDCRLEEVKNR